jgi:hypothetical protein
MKPHFEVTLRQQIEAFVSERKIIGDYEHCFGFYDWFCSDRALEAKAKNLMPKVIKFAKAKGIDLDRHYVWFKNNCPLDGPLYDDFRIASLETGDNVFTVTPKSGHTGLAEVYCQENLWNGPIHQAETWSQLARAI